MNATREKGRRTHRQRRGGGDGLPGIVIRDGKGRGEEGLAHPRISAFVWGRSEPVPPTLPYGRWKADAAA